VTNANASGAPTDARGAKKRFTIKARTETPVRQARPRPRLAVTVLGTMDMEELLNGDQLSVPMTEGQELLAIETPEPVAPLEIVQHLASVDFTRPWVEVAPAGEDEGTPEPPAAEASDLFPDATAIVGGETPAAKPASSMTARRRNAPVTRTLDEDLQELLGDTGETAASAPAPKRRSSRTVRAQTVVTDRASDASATPEIAEPVAWHTPDAWDEPAIEAAAIVPPPVAEAPVTPEPAPTPTRAPAVAWQTPEAWDAPGTEVSDVPAPAPRPPRARRATAKPMAPKRIADAAIEPATAAPNEPVVAHEVTSQSAEAVIEADAAPPVVAAETVEVAPKPRAKRRRSTTSRPTRMGATPTTDEVAPPAGPSRPDEPAAAHEAPSEGAPVAAEPPVEALPVTEELPLAPLPAVEPAPARRRRSARPAIERVDAQDLPGTPVIAGAIAEPGWPELGELTAKPAVSEPSPRGATYTIGLRVGIADITPDPSFTPYCPVYEGSPHRSHDDEDNSAFGPGRQTLRREQLARAVEEALHGA
jgi:hypothetical protein